MLAALASLLSADGAARAAAEADAASLRVPHDDWAGLAARSKSDPAVAAWVQSRAAWLRQWRARPRDAAGYIAGWAHDYLDPANGQPLVWSLDSPEPPLDPGHAREHGAWVYFVRMTNISATLEAARLYRLNGDADPRDYACAQLDFHARNYKLWPVQHFRNTSQMLGQSLDEAVAASQLLEAARLIGERAPPARQAAWDQGLFRPLMANLEISNQGVNNVSVWQAAAQAALAIRLDDDGAFRQALHGPNGIDAMLARGALADGSWFEPSLRYDAYTIEALANLDLWAGLNGRADALQGQMSTTRRMLISLIGLRFDDGTLPGLGDTPLGMKALDPALLALTQRTIPIATGPLPMSWSGLVDPQPVRALPPPRQGLTLMPAAQAAMLRQGDWQVFFHYGQNDASHAQADALGYEARYKEQQVAGPSGIAPYGSRLFLEYIRKGLAHSVPIIDGAGQQKPQAGVLTAHSDAAIAAAQPGYAPGVTVSRAVDLSGAGLQEVTTIAPVVPGHANGIAFNTPCAITGLGLAPGGSVPGGAGFLRHAMSQSVIDSVRFDLDCSWQSMALKIRVDHPARAVLADVPDGSGQYGRHVVIVTGDGVARVETQVSPVGPCVKAIRGSLRCWRDQ